MGCISLQLLRNQPGGQPFLCLGLIGLGLILSVEREPHATLGQQLVGDGDLPPACADLLDVGHAEPLGSWVPQVTRLDEQFGRTRSVGPMIFIGHEPIPGLTEDGKQNAQRLAERFFLKNQGLIGGASESRTRLDGFAIRCITDLLSRPAFA